MAQTIKGLDSAWPDLLINALLFRAGRLEAGSLFRLIKMAQRVAPRVACQYF